MTPSAEDQKDGIESAFESISIQARHKRCRALLPVLNGMPEHEAARLALVRAEAAIKRNSTAWDGSEADASLKEFALILSAALQKQKRAKHSRGGKTSGKNKRERLATRDRRMMRRYDALEKAGTPTKNIYAILSPDFDGLKPRQIRTIRANYLRQ